MPTQSRKTETRTGRNTATTRRKATDDETAETPGKGRATPRRTATPRRARSTAQAAPAPAPAGPPQPVDPANRYAPTAWGAGAAGGPQDLEMPSGQIALVRKPGIQALIAEGVLHKMDSLTALVDKKFVKKGKGGELKAVDVGGLLANNEAFADLMHTVDRVVCAVVIQPPVQMAPNDPTNRQHGVVYADTIDMVDKMFIFGWVTGGTQSLEDFRQQSEEAVGGLSVGESLPGEAE